MKDTFMHVHQLSAYIDALLLLIIVSTFICI